LSSARGTRWRSWLRHCATNRQVAAPRSKAWVCGRSLCWYCRFESRRRHGCLSFVSAMCCKVEVSASGWSLVQRVVCLCVDMNPR
jgi:hypothetical protein